MHEDAMVVAVSTRNMPINDVRDTPMPKDIVVAVESRLRQNAYRAVRSVSCEFHNGVLVLRGRVPNYYLKQITQTIVAGIEGITVIDNLVEVVPPETCRNGNRTSGNDTH